MHQLVRSRAENSRVHPGTLSIGWSLKSCRTTARKTPKASTPALSIPFSELPHACLNGATLRCILAISRFVVAHFTARAFRTFCLRRTEAKEGPVIGIPSSSVGHCSRYEADCASFAKDAVPNPDALVLKSTILSAEASLARAEAARSVGAMPPQIFVRLQILLETTDAHEDVK
jgi:hypothetical protein